MNQEVSAQDLFFGAAVLIVFLICAYGAGRLLSRFKNERFARAWSPLVPLINGTIIDDGGGAATSWLSGTYGGRTIRASMVPGRNLYSGQTGPRYNYFEVALLDATGTGDWSIAHKQSWLGVRQPLGDPLVADKALEERLRQAGVADILTRIAAIEVSYNARQRRLQMDLDVTPRWAPTPEAFEAQLKVLLRLAEINASLAAQ